VRNGVYYSREETKFLTSAAKYTLNDHKAKEVREELNKCNLN
jgi:hypothetical protein